VNLVSLVARPLEGNCTRGTELCLRGGFDRSHVLGTVLVASINYHTLRASLVGTSPSVEGCGHTTVITDRQLSAN